MVVQRFRTSAARMFPQLLSRGSHELLLLSMVVTMASPLPVRTGDMMTKNAMVAGNIVVELGGEISVRSAPPVPRRLPPLDPTGTAGDLAGAAAEVMDPWQINEGICPPPLAHLCRIQAPSPNGGTQDAFVTPFFEGDIVLGWDDRRRQGLANMAESSLRTRRKRPRPSRTRRAIVKGRDFRWPDGIVPYTIDSDFSDESVRQIRAALKHWEKYTCIKFVKKKDTHDDYIRFAYYPGCWSYVGRQGGEQMISMGPGCLVFGTLVHELGHAIGFWHEQSRRDRDLYVQVVYKNIAPGTEENFGKIDGANVTSLGYPYDFNSIMHYTSTAFSSNGKATIRMKKKYRNLLPDTRMGQHDGLSELDIAQTKGVYSCNKKAAKLRESEPCFQSASGDGRDYRGEVDYTENGITCQNWASQYPHEHNYFSDDEARNEKKGIGRHNYCRNPGGRRERPWCYTSLKKTTWQYCDIQICPPQ